MIILFLLLTQLNLPAQTTNYYHYEKYHFRITKREYSRFIRPQMRNILSEIPYNLKEVLGNNKKIIDYSTAIFKSKIKLEQQINLNLFPEKTLIQINSTCLQIARFYKKSVTSNFNLSFNFIQKVKELNYKCIKISNIIDQLLFAQHTTPNLWTKEKSKFTLKISQLHITTIETVKFSFRQELQQDLYNQLTDFYFPLLRIYLLKNKGRILLKKQIDILNNSFNIFLMEMEKKDKMYLPKGHIKRVKLLLNRWNSILKVILRKK